MEDKPTIEELQAAFIAEDGTSHQEVVEEPTIVEEIITEDPLTVELERVRSKKTPQEKAKDSLFFNAQKAKELGLDPAEILGLKIKDEVDEDDRPVTKKELAEMLKAQTTAASTKTAADLAQSITSEAERELTLYHIENTIKSTGNPEEDLKLARALTNSVRNSQIMEEASRKPDAKTHSSASSGGTVQSEPTIVLTDEEKKYLATGLVTKEEILLARQGKAIPQM